MLSIVRRSVILIPGTGGRDNPDGAHLHVVLTDTCSSGCNLLVPICSVPSQKKRRHDRTCLVGIGDHEFLKHPSYVAYYRMRHYSETVLLKHIHDKYFEMRDPLDERVFALVCAGIGRSDESAPRYQRYFATGVLNENNA